MVDQRSFFSETLTWVDDNTFFFSSNTSRQHVIFYHLSPCVSFSIWTIHRATNGSIWRFHLGMFALSYPFQHIFRQNIWSPSCPNFIMFWPTIYAWFTTRLIFLTFRLFSSIFYIVFHMRLGLPHPSIVGIPWCVCTHPINPMGIHFLCYVHGNKHIGTHDVSCNIFVAIARDACFHVGREQLHTFLSITFNSFCWWVDIVLTKYDICTLANVVIVNPMWANLLPQSCVIQGFVAFDVV